LSLVFNNLVLSFQVCDNSSIFVNDSCQYCGDYDTPSTGSFSNDRCVPKCSSGQISILDVCYDCSSGFSPSSMRSSCSQCEPGRFAPISRSPSCSACPVGYFVGTSGATECLACSKKSTTVIEGSLGTQYCVCPAGYFGKAFAGENCSECAHVSGVRCDKQNLSIPLIDDGYFRSPMNVNFAYECIPPQACMASYENQNLTTCADIYTGFLCGECIYGTSFKQGIQCSKCPPKAAVILTWIVIAVLAIAALWLVAADTRSLSAELKIMLFWIQIISTFPSMSSSWPQAMKNFFQLLSITNFDIQIASPECSLPVDFWSKFYFKVSSPLIVFALFILTYLIKTSIKIGFKKSLSIQLLRKAEYFFAVSFTTFQTISTSSLTSAMNCRKQEDGSYSLIEQSSISCFTGSWNRNLGGIVFFSVLHFVIYPAWMIWVFLRFREEIKLSRESIDVPMKGVSAQHLSFLRRYFKKKFYWWSGIDALKRLAIVFAAGLLSGRNASFFVSSTLMTFFLLIDVTCMQYARARHLRTSLLFNAVSIIFLQADAQVFRTGELDPRLQGLVSAFLITCFCASCVGVWGYNFFTRFVSREFAIDVDILDGHDSLLAELVDGRLGTRQVDSREIASAAVNRVLAAKVTLRLKGGTQTTSKPTSDVAAKSTITNINDRS
jgi:hypothetical protein